MPEHWDRPGCEGVGVTPAAPSVDPLDDHPLDNPAWAALSSHHDDLSLVRGRARRYRPDVSVFAAVDVFDERAWSDLADLVGPSQQAVILRGKLPHLPSGWREVLRLGGHQYWLRAEDLVELPDVGPRRLTDDDVPAMLELVALTTPGPFLPRTIEMGRYHGVVDGGRLLAMAGERFHLDGFTEISAVCTHPDARGRGLASSVTHHVARGILERDERPFLHVARGNDGARRIYEALGFTERRTVDFAIAESPTET